MLTCVNSDVSWENCTHQKCIILCSKNQDFDLVVAASWLLIINFVISFVLIHSKK